MMGEYPTTDLREAAYLYLREAKLIKINVVPCKFPTKNKWSAEYVFLCDYAQLKMEYMEGKESSKVYAKDYDDVRMWLKSEGIKRIREKDGGTITYQSSRMLSKDRDTVYKLA